MEMQRQLIKMEQAFQKMSGEKNICDVIADGGSNTIGGLIVEVFHEFLLY